MSGSAYAAKGPSTGPSTNTVWFGGAADHLTMLAQSTVARNGQTSLNGTPAFFGNQWASGSTNNSSFGAFTTAPDGTTNTAQLVVESTANGVHMITSSPIAGNSAIGGSWRMRLAAYCKSSNRRVGLQYCLGFSPFIVTTAVFDLVGGQVGVQPTIPPGGGGAQYNSIFSNLVANIKPVGNGWYLCMLDITLSIANEPTSFANIVIDNGTGTGAISTSYTGDGSSGVYVWRTSMLPVLAYSINNLTLFDDFTSTSTIDLTNSKAPGFNWYIDGKFSPTNFYNQGFTFNPNWLTQSGSHIRVQVTNPNQGGGASPALFGAAQTNNLTGAFVSQNLYSRTRPFLLESRHLWEAGSGIQMNNVLSWWGWMFDYVNGQDLPVRVPLGGEFDFSEIDGGVGSSAVSPFLNGAEYSNGGATFSAQQAPVENGPLLYSGISGSSAGNGVGTGFSNGSDGLQYGATRVIPPGNPPPNATYYTVGSGINTPAFDISAFHTYSALIFPFYGSGLGPNSAEAIGGVMLFVDGIYLGNMYNWSPTRSRLLPNSSFGEFSYIQTVHMQTEYQRFMPIYFFDNNGSGPGVAMQIDFFKAWQ